MYICYYTTRNGNEAHKTFKDLETATEFTRVLDERIGKGLGIGYILTEF